MSARRWTRTLPAALSAAFLVIVVAVIAGCGGSGGGDSASSSSTTPAALANTLPVTVDGGPAAITNTNQLDANTLFATVTVCTPGSTTACQVIDHVQVDTGSTGLRLVASTLGPAVPTAVSDPTTGRPLIECTQFADGYSWGSVATLDVTLGPRALPGLIVQIVGDAAAGSAPSSCISGPVENTVLAFGANGILGIGNFLQDCGAACANRAVSGFYYTCPSGTASCTPTTVALTRQVPNPVSKLGADNNGVVVQLPAVAAPGAASVSGTVYFGIGTQANNALASAARVYGLTTSGTFTATSSGASYAGSFIDSGSNGYFFASTIPVCSDATYFYCPTSTTSVSSTITGNNGLATTVTFNVGNADQLFQSSTITAFPTLAGPNGGLINGTAGAFDFGLPFFFGRTVYVLIEGSTLSGVSAPAIAF